MVRSVCVESGLWTFSPNCPSKKTVDENPFSTELKADVKKRNGDVVLQFYPKVDDANCGCGVSNSFKLLISHYVPQKTSNKIHFQNEFSSPAGNLLSKYL